jgi:hypothetical protein
MAHGECRLNNLDELKDYVYETLCQHDGLVRGAFSMSQQVLIRSGRACGMHFVVHGPRAVMLSAIWETRTSTILFYDSSGQRFMKTQLEASPKLEAVAA